MTQNRCFFCTQEVPEDCPRCWSGHTRIGTVEIVWNGYLARKVEVAWCYTCDMVWFVGADGNRTYVCADCQRRLLEVPQKPAEAATTAA